MSDTAADNRNERGEWRPEQPITLAPINDWPPSPLKIFRWLFAWPGYIWPEHLFYLGITVVTWVFLTPDLASMKSFEAWWIALLFARNLGLILLFFGGIHFFLYLKKGQEDKFRYTTKPFATDSGRFKFRQQVKDNMFHTLASAVPVITAYEAVTYWLFANGYIGFFDIQDPVAFWAWFVILLFLAPVIHAIHFYLGHRLLHVKFFYKHFHALHHNNVEVGPWSGLSMHPVEHVIYFSTVVVQWLIALHPVNALYQLHLASLLPAPGHSGFEKITFGKKFQLAAGSYFHYQHHKYFECNYGGSLIPMDKWFGTFHDGSEKSYARMREQLRARRQKTDPTNA